jgi:hypothetical protein
MDSTIWIIAFSKYSKTCDQLFRMIEELDVTTPFQLLDIDNKKLRKRIKSTSNFSIEYVPCVISVNSMGIASQYEGQKAFEIVKRMSPQPPPPPPPPQRVQHVQVEPSQPSQQQTPPPPTFEQQGVTPIENLMDEPPMDVSGGGKGSAIKGNKLSVSQIMKNAPKDEPVQQVQLPTIEQKSGGSKISVSEIMSQYQ